jgi:hypothetical protein
LKYRKDGKEMRLALGSYPAVSLAEVRIRQSEAKALKHKGIDPVHATSRLVSSVGVENLIVVETPDHVLVADMSRSQDFKHIVTRYKKPIARSTRGTVKCIVRQ